MSKNINQYRFFCNTENIFVYTWSISVPTCCPNNNTDVIDLSSITIIDTINSNAVSIIQNNDDIQGYYRMECLTINVLPNQTSVKTFSWPYNISVLTINWTSNEIYKGDILNVYSYPNTIIGFTTEDINIGDSVINVSDTVMQHIIIGSLITISNGTTSISFGDCINKDVVDKTITCSVKANYAFQKNSQVLMTMQHIKNYVFNTNEEIRLANKHLQSTYLKANKIVKIMYQNNSNVSKIFTPFIEYLI